MLPFQVSSITLQTSSCEDRDMSRSDSVEAGLFEGKTSSSECLLLMLELVRLSSKFDEELGVCFSLPASAGT